MTPAWAQRQEELILHSAHCRKGRCGRLAPLIFQTTVSANFGHRAIGQAFKTVMGTVDSCSGPQSS